MNISLLILFLTVFNVNISGQRYDFSDGDASSIRACNGFEDWFPASVDDYPEHPSGPIEGFVLKSPLANSNCITLVENIDLYQDSIFHIEMISQRQKDSLTIYVLDDEGEVIRDWFFIQGKEGWIVEASEIPPFTVSDTKQYNVEIFTTAIPTASFISIRYFEITNGSVITTTTTDDSTSSTTELTSNNPSSTIELTTEDLSSFTAESTTDSLISLTNAPTTESTTNEPTTTTETITTPTNNPSFEVDGWSIVIGITIGVILATLLYAVSAVAGWIFCLQKIIHKNSPIAQSNSLPRLQVVSNPGSGTGITAQTAQSSKFQI